MQGFTAQYERDRRKAIVPKYCMPQDDHIAMFDE